MGSKCPFAVTQTKGECKQLQEVEITSEAWTVADERRFLLRRKVALGTVVPRKKVPYTCKRVRAVTSAPRDEA